MKFKFSTFVEIVILRQKRLHSYLLVLSLLQVQDPSENLTRTLDALHRSAHMHTHSRFSCSVREFTDTQTYLWTPC